MGFNPNNVIYDAINKGRTHLLKALETEHLNVLYGIDRSDQSMLERVPKTPLNAMIENGTYNDIVCLLLDKSPDRVNSIDGYKTPSPLFVAIQSNNSGMVNELIQRGADVNGHYPFGKHDMTEISSPLGLAVENDDVDLAKRLVEAGAIVNDVNNKYPMLHCVSSVQMCKFLIDKGANVNATDIDGMNKTPLHVAIDMRREDIAKCLIDAGADVTKKSLNGFGKSPEEVSEFVCSYAQKRRIQKGMGDAMTRDQAAVKKRRM